jgi:hypothetical protein
MARTATEIGSVTIAATVRSSKNQTPVSSGPSPPGLRTLDRKS